MEILRYPCKISRVERERERQRERSVLVKANLSLYLTKYHAMKNYGGAEV
jgi:hypothetical protein